VENQLSKTTSFSSTLKIGENNVPTEKGISASKYDF